MEEKRKSTLKPATVLFFVFAALCVIAFLIVILVKSCEADHEENQLIKEIENNNVGQNLYQDSPEFIFYS